MEDKPYWISKFNPKGTKRLNKDFLYNWLNKESIQKIENATINSSCWAEITYLNTFDKIVFNDRTYLLGIVFAIMLKQYGFAAKLSLVGIEKSSDPIFKETLDYIKFGLNIETKSFKSRLRNFLINKINSI